MTIATKSGFKSWGSTPRTEPEPEPLGDIIIKSIRTGETIDRIPVKSPEPEPETTEPQGEPNPAGDWGKVPEIPDTTLAKLDAVRVSWEGIVDKKTVPLGLTPWEFAMYRAGLFKAESETTKHFDTEIIPDIKRESFAAGKCAGLAESETRSIEIGQAQGWESLAESIFPDLHNLVLMIAEIEREYGEIVPWESPIGNRFGKLLSGILSDWDREFGLLDKHQAIDCPYTEGENK